MTGLRKMIAGCLLIAMLLSLGCLFASAEKAADPSPDLTNASAVYFYHMESQRSVVAKNETQRLPAGTSVRMLSGLIFCERLGDRMSEWVEIHEEMLRASKTSYRYGIEAGEFYTVEQLLYLALCGGYNDATLVVACLSSGSVAAFVEDMNREVQRLGTIHTRYTNPTGLHDPAMATSARDVSLSAREAYENDLFMNLSSTRTYTISATNVADERVFTNRNALISDCSQNY